MDFPQERRARTLMEDLPDDLILEIMSRLPLKYAIRCRGLNRTFRLCLSHRSFTWQHALLSSSRSGNTTIFHCSGEYPKIFTTVTLESNPRVPTISKTLPFGVSILASCNGVLLLHVEHFRAHCVFNPITGQIWFVDYPIHAHDDVGLVVDLEVDFSSQNYQFKLVMVDIKPRRIGNQKQSVLRFKILAPSHTSFGSFEISEVDFVCENFTLLLDQNIRPVYAHGSLYWLGEDARKIVEFNVETKQARIINGPVENFSDHGFHSGVAKWFGFAHGSLSFVYTLPKIIIVHSYDYYKNEWKIRHKIANLCTNNDYRNGVPVFFDGQRLFLQLRKLGEDGVVHMHDFLSGKWEKRGVVEEWSDFNQIFIPFFPTSAKVSDVYLHLHNSTSRWEREITNIKDGFLCLQQLLWPAAATEASLDPKDPTESLY